MRTFVLAVALAAPAFARQWQSEAPVPKHVRAQKYDALASLMGVAPDPDDSIMDELKLVASPDPSPAPSLVLSCADAEQKIAAAYRESVSMRATLKLAKGRVNTAEALSMKSNTTLDASTATVREMSTAVKQGFEKGLELLGNYMDAEEKNATETAILTLTATMYNTVIKKWHAAVVDGHNNAMLAAQNAGLVNQASEKVEEIEGQLEQLHVMTESFSQCEETGSVKSDVLS
jgi:hypothetical protein